MKCNVPKPPNPRDIARLREELCKVRCYKCGAVIEQHKEPIYAIQEKCRRMRLCKKCRGDIR